MLYFSSYSFKYLFIPDYIPVGNTIYRSLSVCVLVVKNVFNGPTLKNIHNGLSKISTFL